MSKRYTRFKTHLFLQDIPFTTKMAFKSACARRGKTMRNVLIHFMRYYYKETFKVIHKGQKSLDQQKEKEAIRGH